MEFDELKNVKVGDFIIVDGHSSEVDGRREVIEIDLDDSYTTLAVRDDDGYWEWITNVNVSLADVKTIKKSFTKDQYDVIKKIGVSKVESILEVLRVVSEKKSSIKTLKADVKSLEDF